MARWMLEEVGEPYETKVLNYGPEMKSPDYLAVNPMGKVPALKHGDTVVTECAAICAYLADAFPAAGLAPPAGSKLRGPYYRWLFFAAGPVDFAATAKATGFQAPEENAGMVSYGSFATLADALAKAVGEGPYILGDQFTAVDVYLGAQIAWGVQFGTIESRPEFDPYVERIMSRPTAMRAKEIDDALVPAEAG